MSGSPDDALDRVLAELALRDGRAHAEIPASWGQGRTIFGGIVGALAMRTMTLALPDPRPPRSLQVAFLAPLRAGVADIEVEVLRVGSKVVHVSARVLQDGRPGAVALATFGHPRPGTLRVAGLAAPDVPRPDAVPTLPDLPFLPVFVRHFDMRFTTGGIPFSGSDARTLGGWCRPMVRHAAVPIDAAGLVAVVDTWPASVLPNLRAPAAASTVSWSVDFAPGAVPAPADTWWLYEARTEIAGEGYASSTAYVWSEAGQLVAASRQTVAVFEP